MTWYRYQWADLKEDILKEAYPHSRQRPVRIALEGSVECLVDANGLNAVLYLDQSMEIEKNDFFFESIDDAMTEIEEIFGISDDHWEIHSPAIEIG